MVNSIFVYPEGFLLKNKVNRKYFHEGAIISIMSPHVKRQLNLSFFDFVLELDFHDFDFHHLDILKEKEYKDWQVFNIGMAKQVFDFVGAVKEQNIENLTIHCEAGVSRSPAVGYSLYYCGFGKNITCNSTLPNMYVFHVMVMEYGRRMREMRKEELRERK